jgi:hypothetical protein
MNIIPPPLLKIINEYIETKLIFEKELLDEMYDISFLLEHYNYYPNYFILNSNSNIYEYYKKHYAHKWTRKGDKIMRKINGNYTIQIN